VFVSSGFGQDLGGSGQRTMEDSYTIAPSEQCHGLCISSAALCGYGCEASTISLSPTRQRPPILLSGHNFISVYPGRNLWTGGSERVSCGLDQVRAFWALSLGRIVTASHRVEMPGVCVLFLSRVASISVLIVDSSFIYSFWTSAWGRAMK